MNEQGETSGQNLGSREIREQHEWMRSIIQHDLSGIAVLDKALRYIFVSDRFLRNFNLRESDIIGKAPAELLPSIPEKWISIHERCLAGAVEKNEDDRLQHPDGSITYTRWECRPWFCANGKIGGVVMYTEDITERKQLEETMRRQKEELETIFNTVPAQIWIKDTHNGFLRVNDKICQDLGIPRETVEGHTAEELFPEFAEKYYQDDLDVIRTGQPKLGIIEQINTLSGSKLWLHTDKFPVKDARGQVIGLLIFTIDFTARREAEEALRRQKEEFEMIFNTVPAQIWYKDTHNGILRVNDKICQDLGIPREALEGHTSEEVFPEFAAKYLKDDLEVVNSGQPKLGIIEQINTQSGSRLWIHSDKFPVRDAEGNVVGVIIFVVDLTARIQIEGALRASEERLHLATSAGNIGVWDWNIVKNELTWDDSMYSLYGITKGDFGGAFEAWTRTVHPEDRPFAEAEIQAVLRNKREYDVEFRIIRPDGTLRTLKAQARTFRDANGSPVRMVGTNIDITERKLAEESIQKAREAAEIANQAKDQFIAVLSHELRTPLVPVLATVTTLETEANLPPELKADLALIRSNVEMEARLIDDLLDITKISKGKIALRLEAVDTHACLQTALTICGHTLETKHLEVVLDLRAKEHYVWADPIRLQQVFWNLFSNAVKFTPPEGRITVRSENHDGELQIEISDTGIGIEPTVMPRLFRLFEQGQQSKTRQFGGLGLGLSIAKAMLELHHGTLTAFSEGKDKGATFTVKLATIPTPAEVAKPVAAPLPGVEGPRNILLVDDHPDTLSTLAKLLRRWGYAVQTATCVREALERAAKEPFDLIISDLGLPDGSGLDIMREVSRAYGLRGIALSGYGTEEDIRASEAAGFEEHMTKPISFDALRASIGRVIAAGVTQGR
jgi:PAS domain S-box-containing protein